MSPSDVERDTQKENSYTKHACRKRLPVTATLSRVNETSQLYAWGILKCWANEIRSSAKHFSIRKGVSVLAWKQTEQVSKVYRVSINCYSWRAYVQNLLILPEHESDHKTLYNVEKTCGAIIVSLYMAAAHPFGAFVRYRLKRIGCVRRIKFNEFSVFYI